VGVGSIGGLVPNPIDGGPQARDRCPLEGHLATGSRCGSAPATDELRLDRRDSAGHPVFAGEALLQLPRSLAEAWLACQRPDARGQVLGAETLQSVGGRADAEPLKGAPPGGLIRKERDVDPNN